MNKLAITCVVVLFVAMTLAGETLQYIDFDADSMSQTEGENLCPYVFDGTGRSVREDQNAGYLNVGFGKEKRFTLEASVAEEDKELTTEFFVKGGENGIAPYKFLLYVGQAWNGGTQTLGLYSAQNKMLALHVFLKDGTSIVYTSATTSLTDGKWHHVALTIKPIVGGSHIAAYIDYVKVIDQETTSPCKYVAYMDINRQYGKANPDCEVDVDEVRFTRGILEPSQFLRLKKTPNPIEGESVVYIPFDGNAISIVHQEYQVETQGDFVYSADIKRPTDVVEHGTRMKIRSTNLQSAHAGNTGTVCWFDSFSLAKENSSTWTIEFMMKGNDLSEMKDWESPLSYGSNVAGVYGLLVKMRTSGIVCFQPGVLPTDTSINVAEDLSDGKWRHFAVTFAPSTTSGYEGGTHVEVFCNYKLVATKDYLGIFRGIAPVLDKNGCGPIYFYSCGGRYSFDEFRVTKGVLPVEKFIDFGKLGMALLVR